MESVQLTASVFYVGAGAVPAYFFVLVASLGPDYGLHVLLKQALLFCKIQQVELHSPFFLGPTKFTAEVEPLLVRSTV